MDKGHSQNKRKHIKRVSGKLAKIALVSIAISSMAVSGNLLESNHLKYGISTIHAAQASRFKDVPANHWASAAIEWARARGLVNGFPDGTFRPENNLTEAEFLAIFLRYMENIDEVPISNSKHWADGVYKALEGKGYPIRGAVNSKMRDEPIPRGLIAQILYHSQGNLGSVDEAIQWMFDTGLSNGMTTTGDLRTRFGDTSYLTRGQVAAFFEKMDLNGVKDVKPNNGQTTPAYPIPSVKAPYTGPSKPTDLANIEKLVESLPSFPADGQKIQYALPGVPPATVYTTSPNKNTGVSVFNDARVVIKLQSGSNDADKALFKDILKHYFPTKYEVVYKDALTSGKTSRGVLDGLTYDTSDMYYHFDGMVMIYLK